MTSFLNEQAGKLQTPIRPFSIRLSETGTVQGAFGKYEVELAAGRLVQFFLHQNRWCAFTLTQLAVFYRFKGWDPDGMLFGLAGLWFDDGGVGCVREGFPYLLFSSDGTIEVALEFVERCAQAAHAA